MFMDSIVLFPLEYFLHDPNWSLVNCYWRIFWTQWFGTKLSLKDDSDSSKMLNSYSDCGHRDLNSRPNLIESRVTGFLLQYIGVEGQCPNQTRRW